MNLPDSKSFFKEIECAFSFLRPAGFEFPESGKESTPTYDSILILGKNVAFAVSLDRRDECIDFYIARVKDGEVIRNDVPGGYWGHFHGFVVKNRKYRGAFSEFRGASHKDEETFSISVYANALKALAPDAAMDSEKVFG